MNDEEDERDERKEKIKQNQSESNFPTMFAFIYFHAVRQSNNKTMSFIEDHNNIENKHRMRGANNNDNRNEIFCQYKLIFLLCVGILFVYYFIILYRKY